MRVQVPATAERSPTLFGSARETNHQEFVGCVTSPERAVGANDMVATSARNEQPIGIRVGRLEVVSQTG